MIPDIADPEYDPIKTFGGFYSEPPFCYTTTYRLRFVASWLAKDTKKPHTTLLQESNDVVDIWKLAGWVECKDDGSEKTFAITEYGKLILADFQIRNGMGYLN